MTEEKVNSGLADTWIFLMYDRVDDVEGRIAYIGKETTRESDQIKKWESGYADL